MSMHADLLAELQRPDPEIAWVLELDHPTAGTIYMSREGVASKAGGYYERWILSFGELTLTLSNWRGGLEAPTFSVEIDDTGGRWTRKYGWALRRAAARLYLMSPNVDAAAYFLAFSGVVDSTPRSGLTRTINLRMNDDLFSLEVPRSKVKANAFPGLPTDSALVGKAIPYLRGSHDSTGLAALGMVPGLFVGEVAGKWRYVFCLGWWAEVGRVFSAGSEKVETTDYVVVQTLTGDLRKVTAVDFLADQEDNEILADIREEEDMGPAEALQRTLTDIAWNDYFATDEDVSTCAVDSTAVAAFDAFTRDVLGLRHSYYIPTERRSVADILREFAASYDAQISWRYDGKLIVRAWDLSAQNDQAYRGFGAPDGTLAQEPVLQRAGISGEPEFDQDPEAEVAVLNGKSGRRASDGSWINARSVVLRQADLLNRARDMELPWLPSTAESLGNVAYLIADADSSIVELNAVGAATVWEVLSQGPPPAPKTTGIYATTPSSPTNPEATVRLSDLPEAVAIATVAVWVNFRTIAWDPSDDDQLDVGIRLGAAGTPHTQIVSTQGGGLRSAGVYSADPDTLLAWSRTGVNSLHGYLFWGPPTSNPSKKLRFYQLFCIVNYTAAANVNPALLAVLSRIANRYRTAPLQFGVDVKSLAWLDKSLGDDVAVELPELGWSGKPWSRGHARIVGVVLRPGAANPLRLVLEDVRAQQTTLWLWGKALAGVDVTTSMGDGMAMITNGATVTVERNTVKFLESPAGLGVQTGPIVQILANTWPSERGGTLVERQVVQQIDRSSFKSGGTGWSTSAGSGAVTYDETVGAQFFEQASGVLKHWLCTAGSPHSTETRSTLSTAINANVGGVLSFDYMGSSLIPGDGLSWRAVRTSDGFYWNDSSGAWQLGAVDNALPESLTWTTAQSKMLTALGKGGTFTLSISVPAGGTAERTVRCGHVHFHAGMQWAGSRFVTDGASATREADAIKISNGAVPGVTTWPNTRGACTWRVAALWSSSLVTAATAFWLLDLPYDANNGWSLRYVVGTGWQFIAKAAGVSYTCTVDVAVVAGTEYDVLVRWTSALGEWDKPLTLTLVVKDASTGAVLGSAEATYAKPTETSNATLYFYSSASPTASQFDGYIIEIRETPFPPSDVEMGLATATIEYGEDDAVEAV